MSNFGGIRASYLYETDPGVSRHPVEFDRVGTNEAPHEGDVVSVGGGGEAGLDGDGGAAFADGSELAHLLEESGRVGQSDEDHVGIAAGNYGGRDSVAG